MKVLDRETDLTMDLLIYDWNYLHGLTKRTIRDGDGEGNDGELFQNMNTRVLSEPILLLLLLIHQLEKLSIY